VLSGNPAAETLDEAQQFRADAIVVTTRTRSSVKHDAREGPRRGA
jgi:hypothetical protein